MEISLEPKSIRILVIEDNVSDLKLIHSVLASAGHQVSEAVSAEEAIDLLAESDPQVILTDLALPSMDGIALARHLKQESRTAEIPLIAVTSYPDHFSRRKVNDAGFEAFIVKPINTRTLCGQISGILDRL